MTGGNAIITFGDVTRTGANLPHSLCIRNTSRGATEELGKDMNLTCEGEKSAELIQMLKRRHTFSLFLRENRRKNDVKMKLKFR